MKELPYFKFYPAEYLQGDIIFEKLENQGVFINICAYYWSKNCEVSYNILTKFVQKLGVSRAKSEKIIKNLIENKIIFIENEQIIIKFLNTQFTERQEKYRVLSEAGKKGGIFKKEATLKPPLIKKEATLKHIDKDKEEDKDKDNIKKEKETSFKSCLENENDINIIPITNEENIKLSLTAEKKLIKGVITAKPESSAEFKSKKQEIIELIKGQSDFIKQSQIKLIQNMNFKPEVNNFNKIIESFAINVVTDNNTNRPTAETITHFINFTQKNAYKYFDKCLK